MANAKNRSTKKSTTKNEVVSNETLAVNMTASAEAAGAEGNGEVVIDEGGESLDAVLQALETPVPGAAAVETVIEDSALDAAIVSAEATEASLAVATPEGVVEAGAVPSGTTSDAEPIAAATTETKAKKVATPRKHYSDKVERLKDRMGAGLAEYTVLTMEDAGVDPAELQAKMDETLVIIKAMNKKEQARASMFIEFLAGKKAKPNEVLDRALRVLARDGKITTGKDGNLFLDLVAKPYHPASARAMGGNTIGMLADLKVLVADGKQVFKGNPDSLLLAKANSLIFAPTAGTTEPEPTAA
jgi:hypothetical protein